jgi:hypothetical protein
MHICSRHGHLLTQLCNCIFWILSIFWILLGICTSSVHMHGLLAGARHPPRLWVRSCDKGCVTSIWRAWCWRGVRGCDMERVGCVVVCHRPRCGWYWRVCHWVAPWCVVGRLLA